MTTTHPNAFPHLGIAYHQLHHAIEMIDPYSFAHLPATQARDLLTNAIVILADELALPAISSRFAAKLEKPTR